MIFFVLAGIALVYQFILLFAFAAILRARPTGKVSVSFLPFWVAVILVIIGVLV